MPTPSEQKALAFLVFVILLGGAVRVVRAGATPAPTGAEVQALDHQVAVADSAAARGRAKKPRKVRVRPPTGRDSGAAGADPFAGVPVSDSRRDRPQGATSRYDPRAGWVNGNPPPSPRIDTDYRRGAASPGASPDSVVIDLDVATAEEIDRLPRIGPGTAARILANRDSFGPFRSLAGLARVRGMGPATLRRLAPRVTFSGRAASISAGNRHR